MNKFKALTDSVVLIVGLAGITACVDAVETGTATEEILTTFSGLDPGVGPGQARPNSNAARASYEAALGGAALTRVDFEGLPLGGFATLAVAPGVTATLSSTNNLVGATGISDQAGNPTILGYNTTAGGSRYLKFETNFGAGTVSATFTYATPIRGFGANFTAVGTVGGTAVAMLFDDGSQQTFAIPGAANGGVSFFGFTDPGKGITQVTIRETLLGTGGRDIFGVDDLTTAIDNLAPIALCADVTVNADTTCQGGASIDGGSTDPDGDAFTCVQSPASPYALGSTAVTLTCTDVHGTSSSCTGTVTVVDATAPDLACPGDQTLECDDGGAVATFAASAGDSCDSSPTVACAPPSGSTFPLGDTEGTCTATDDAANTSTCTHVVTVADTVPPVVTTTSAGALWPPNHKYRRVDLSQCIGAIEDACHGPLSLASAQITCCASDEPDDGDGDGNTSNDCVIVDHDSVDLRAERAGGGDGRVYTIAYTVTDPSGNTTSQTCSVGVPHSQNGAPAVDSGALACPGT